MDIITRLTSNSTIGLVMAFVDESKYWLTAAFELIIHVVIGTILFSTIFSVVIGLDLMITFLKNKLIIGDFVIWLLISVKYVVAILDVICYLSLLIRMATKFNKNIWNKANC